jgi:predicted LPLAT superfamily acyltransferase
MTGGRHWAGIREIGTVTGIRLLFTVYRWFGRWLFQPAALAVAGYFTLAAPAARAASREFLSQVWRHSSGRCGLGRPPDLLTTIRHFYAFAGAILDKLAAWNGDIDLRRVDESGGDVLWDRHRSGSGGVWITAHLGNVETCRAIARRSLDLRLTVLVHTGHAENFNRILRSVAPDSGVEVLEVSSFDIAMAMRLKDRVDRGHFIVVVGDRVPVAEAGRTVCREFLGRRARFPVGPFFLAALLDCPAGTLFCVRDGDRFRMFIEDLPGLQSVPRAGRQAAVEAAAGVFVSRLEALCLRYPLQWFNFFPFWDDEDAREGMGDVSQ